MDSFTITGPKFLDDKPFWKATAKLVNWHYVIDDANNDGYDNNTNFKAAHRQVRHFFLKETEDKKMLPGTMVA